MSLLSPFWSSDEQSLIRTLYSVKKNSDCKNEKTQESSNIKQRRDVPFPPNAEQTNPLEKHRNNFFKKVFPINILSKLMVNQAYKNSKTSRYPPDKQKQDDVQGMGA